MNQKKNDADWGGWLLTIIMLAAFWPVGLFLLFRQLMGYGHNNRRNRSSVIKRHPYDIQKEAERGNHGLGEAYDEGRVRSDIGQPGTSTFQGRAKGGKNKEKKIKATRSPVNLPRGKTLMIVGGAIAGVFGIGLLSTLGEAFSYGAFYHYVEDITSLSGFFCGGLVCLYVGFRRRRQAKRFKKYYAYIGKNRTVSLSALSAAMGVKEKVICEDLQDMLDAGVLPVGYIDLANRRLVLSDEGISETASQAPPQDLPEKKTMEDENAILQEIREVNDAIPDEAMSIKIDRIGEITGKILDYQRSHPGKSGQLRSFLNYYLPTTLKVLRAYAQLDAQGIEGENISAAKKRIEGMMDQVVYGFEKQLDRLFQNDALDITSDVEVLESMLRKDGLSGGMTLGGGCMEKADFSPQQAYLDLQKVVDELSEKGSSKGIT